MAKSNKDTRPEARLPRGLSDTSADEVRGARPHAGHHPRGLRVLRLRAAGDAGHRVHRCAGQVPARPGPAQRGRVLVPGRGRAVAVAALRPDRAARPLRRRELRQAAEALPALCRRAPCGATRSRGPAASASSPSSTPTRSAPTTSPPTPRSACWRPTRWRRSASRAASTSSRSTTARCSTACWPASASIRVSEADAAKRLTVLRAVDKLDRLGPHGVAMLLGKGRKDESGDFTPGAGLDAKAVDAVLRFVGAGLARAGQDAGRHRAAGGWGRDRPRGPCRARRDGAAAGRRRLRRRPRRRRRQRRARARLLHRPRVRGRSSPSRCRNEDGQPVRFGSVGGGGRYDDLVARFTGQRVPATGFSIGVSRLQAALAATRQDRTPARRAAPSSCSSWIRPSCRATRS